jgi:hypothetical protein
MRHRDRRLRDGPAPAESAEDDVEQLRQAQGDRQRRDYLAAKIGPPGTSGIPLEADPRHDPCPVWLQACQHDRHSIEVGGTA